MSPTPPGAMGSAFGTCCRRHSARRRQTLRHCTDDAENHGHSPAERDDRRKYRAVTATLIKKGSPEKRGSLFVRRSVRISKKRQRSFAFLRTALPCARRRRNRAAFAARTGARCATAASRNARGRLTAPRSGAKSAKKQAARFFFGGLFVFDRFSARSLYTRDRRPCPAATPAS